MAWYRFCILMLSGALSCLGFHHSSPTALSSRLSSSVARKHILHAMNKEDTEQVSTGKRTYKVVEPIPASHVVSTEKASTLSPELTSEEEDSALGIWEARGILLLVAAIWGTNFAVSHCNKPRTVTNHIPQCVKYLEQLCFHPPCNHPPSEFAFARFGVAAVVSMPLLFQQRWDVIKAGLECGAWIFLGYTTQALALSTISAGKCAFICSLTVVFVPILAQLLYGKRITGTNVVAAVIALSGVGVLEGMIDFNSLLGIAPAVAVDASHSIASTTIETASASAGPLSSMAHALGVTKGDILALGQPIGFGYSFLRIEHYQEKFKDVPNRILTIAAAQCVSVGLLAFLWVLKDYSWTLPDFGYMNEPHRIAAIAWTGMVTTVFAIFLEGIALQKATATDAAITFSSEPVWASIFGFLLLHEQLGINSYVGGAIILTACLVGSVSDMMGEQTETDDTPT